MSDAELALSILKKITTQVPTCWWPDVDGQTMVESGWVTLSEDERDLLTRLDPDNDSYTESADDKS